MQDKTFSVQGSEFKVGWWVMRIYNRIEEENKIKPHCMCHGRYDAYYSLLQQGLNRELAALFCADIGRQPSKSKIAVKTVYNPDLYYACIPKASSAPASETFYCVK